MDHVSKLKRFSFFTSIAGLLAVLPLPADLPSAKPVTVLTWSGHRMFEDFSARSEVSPDGQWVLRAFVDGNQALLHLPSGTSDSASLRAGLQDFERAAWCGSQLLRLGKNEGKRSWFLLSGGAFAALSIPSEATFVCNAAGDHFAHFTSFPARRELPPPKDIYIGTNIGTDIAKQGTQSRVEIGGVVLAARFSPDAKYVYVLSRQESGASTLSSVEVSSLRTTQLARDLDAWPFPGPELAVSSDGKSLVLPLATLKAPDDARRQAPRLSHFRRASAARARRRIAGARHRSAEWLRRPSIGRPGVPEW